MERGVWLYPLDLMQFGDEDFRSFLLPWQPRIAQAMSSHAGYKHPAEHCQRGIYHSDLVLEEEPFLKQRSFV